MMDKLVADLCLEPAKEMPARETRHGAFRPISNTSGLAKTARFQPIAAVLERIDTILIEDPSMRNSNIAALGFSQHTLRNDSITCCS